VLSFIGVLDYALKVSNLNRLATVRCGAIAAITVFKRCINWAGEPSSLCLMTLYGNKGCLQKLVWTVNIRESKYTRIGWFVGWAALCQTSNNFKYFLLRILVGNISKVPEDGALTKSYSVLTMLCRNRDGLTLLSRLRTSTWV